jgi:hypothetical protein
MADVEMQPSKIYPALLGGLVMGVLSALPIISALNLCCCLWLVSGGVVAAYVLQQNQAAPVTQADGATVGFLAGLIGALVYLVLSIPITFLIAPLQREILLRMMERARGVPPELRDYLDSYVGGIIGIAISFIFMLFTGVIFSTIGGLLGAVLFRRPRPTEATDRGA